MKVTFLGAGLYGRALGKLAELNGHEVEYYDPYRFFSVELPEAVEGVDAVVYTAPAEAYPEILPELSADTPLILASKGFVSTKPFERFKNFSVLGGAAFAEDIMDMRGRNGMPIVLTASSPLAGELLTTDFLTIEHTEDSKGIMLCGALKNVYSIGAGIFEGLDESQDYVITAAHEMQIVAVANGGKPETLELSCGVPDLMISCTNSGRNYRFGLEISRHPHSRLEPIGTIEGITVVNSLKKFPDFVIPEEAKLFSEIVRKVKGATE